MSRRRTPATNTLLAVIVAVFGIDMLLRMYRGDYLAYYGAVIGDLVVYDHQYWRLITAIFLHANLLHLLVNGLALFQLGRLYELMFGTRRFLLIYFAAGLGGTIASTISTLRDPGASVGASGAIFGILGAFIFSVRRSPLWRQNPMARNLVAQCVFWMIANLVIGFTIPRIENAPQIDNAGHLGGLAVGLLLGLLLPHRVPPPPPAQVVIDVPSKPYDD